LAGCYLPVDFIVKDWSRKPTLR